MTFFQRSLCLFSCLLASPLFSWAEPQIIENQDTTLVYPSYWHTPMGIHRGTPQLLAMFVGDRTHLDHPQDLTCNLMLGRKITKDENPEFVLTVLGANTNQRHLLYNPSLTQLEVLGDRAPYQNLFKTPLGVVLAPDGTAWVSDPGQGQVFGLIPRNGRLVPDQPLPPPPGGWGKPWGVALDSQGRIYVTDSQRNQIFVYSADRIFSHAVGPRLSAQVTLDQPQSITVADPDEVWNFYHGQFLVVTDQQGARIIRLDFKGIPRGFFPAAALPAADNPPQFAWLELDYYENIWVTDTRRNQIHKFDRDLNYLTSFGQPGEGDGKFTAPTGLAINRHFGQVFVADAASAHYFWIGTDLLRPKAQRLSPRPLVQFDFFLTEPSQVKIDLVSRQPAVRERVWELPWMDSGRHRVYLNVPAACQDQPFQLICQVEATYSSASYMIKQVHVDVP